MTIKDHLTAIFDADRTMRAAERQLLEAEAGKLEEQLTAAVEEAKGLSDDSEQSMRLERLADLCAQVPGPNMADTLIRILDCEAPNIRVAAAEALVDVAFERYAEVARAAERHLERGQEGPAMGELPWVIAEIAEPSAVSLIARFLKLQDSTLVASALEALAALGDPAALPHIEPLTDDGRAVALDEYDGDVTATIGELATEVADNLEAIENGEVLDDD
ncbi:MAG: hypothetical protein OXU20_42070 [Myxococcales bacterium]|nr:hypothetical protein [Myxococcales bacterium]MDD9965766.1 hypothetical protein [Myxococcales bacterium]